MDRTQLLLKRDFDLNAYLQENTLIMYSDDSLLDEVVDTVDDIIDLSGSARFYFIVGFNVTV